MIDEEFLYKLGLIKLMKVITFFSDEVSIGYNVFTQSDANLLFDASVPTIEIPVISSVGVMLLYHFELHEDEIVHHTVHFHDNDGNIYSCELLAEKFHLINLHHLKPLIPKTLEDVDTIVDNIAMIDLYQYLEDDDFEDDFKPWSDDD